MSSDLTRDAQHQVVSRCQKIVNRRSQSTAQTATCSWRHGECGRKAHNPSSSRKQARGVRPVQRSLRFCSEAKLCSRRSAALFSCGNMCDGGRVSIIPSGRLGIYLWHTYIDSVYAAQSGAYSPQYPSAGIRPRWSRTQRIKAGPLIGVSKCEGPPYAHKPHERWNTVRENDQYASTTPHRPPPTKTSSRTACASTHLHTRRLHAQRHPRECIPHKGTPIHPIAPTHRAAADLLSAGAPTSHPPQPPAAPTSRMPAWTQRYQHKTRRPKTEPPPAQTPTRIIRRRPRASSRRGWFSGFRAAPLHPTRAQAPYIRMRMRTPSSRTTQPRVSDTSSTARARRLLKPQAHPAPLRASRMHSRAARQDIHIVSTRPCSASRHRNCEGIPTRTFTRIIRPRPSYPVRYI
ncbi:hypothetical protein B0H13DRAFT_2491618 [Mycena leptocephala]|nr:hypothetical protein B0H13DRAFT_2491618 [Mycena leptocephala]